MVVQSTHTGNWAYNSPSDVLVFLAKRDAMSQETEMECALDVTCLVRGRSSNEKRAERIVYAVVLYNKGQWPE